MAHFVIISNTHPAVLTQDGECADSEAIVISFASLPPARVVEVLNYVESRIRRERLDETEVELEVLWIRLTSWWDQIPVFDLAKEVSLRLLSD